MADFYMALLCLALMKYKFSSFVTIACVHGKVVYDSAGNVSTKINHVISSRMIQVFLKFTFLDRKNLFNLFSKLNFSSINKNSIVYCSCTNVLEIQYLKPLK